MSKQILPWLGVALVVIVSVLGILYLVGRQTGATTAGTPLSVAVSASDWQRGAASPKVTLVEYGDFQCPACASYYPLVHELESEFASDLSFVFRHYPLGQHANAMPASRASEAAGKQGKFWEMYDLLYTKQNEWAEKGDAAEQFSAYAQAIGLDLARFGADLANTEAIDQKIADQKKSGDTSQVLGTPTFFVNGKKIANPGSYAEFKTIIENARKNP
ncbi:MAG: thioredoxin domain-containing protein [Patescibacteria group bacterium]